MSLIVSQGVKQKLAEKHNVQIHEIRECFSNRNGDFLKDNREDHKTDPPTLWFVAETDYGKLLKVVFIQKGNDFIVKTTYEANDTEVSIYNKFA